MASIDEKRETLATALQDVLEHFRSELSEPQIADIECFIDNFEFGVALDWLMSIVETQGLPLSSAARDDIKKALGLMHQDEQP